MKLISLTHVCGSDVSSVGWMSSIQSPAMNSALIKRCMASRTDALPWLFISERGQPFTRQPVNYLIAEAAARAGLPPVHPHMLRHSCGFSLANRGYDLRLIQDYLGHRDPKHTVHYTRVAAGRFGFGVESGRFHAEGDQTFTV